MKKTALILVDIQNDYFPGGSMELDNSMEAGSNAAQILNQFRDRSLPVIHIQHLSTRPDASFFIPGTHGFRIADMVTPLPLEPVLIKHLPNSFKNTDLERILNRMGITHLVIVGMMTHMCIDATCRAATDLGFSCILVPDACATRDIFFNELKIPAQMVQAAFLAALSGIYARLVPAAEVMALLESG